MFYFYGLLFCFYSIAYWLSTLSQSPVVLFLWTIFLFLLNCILVGLTCAEHFKPLYEHIGKLEEALYNIQFEQHWLEAQTDRQAIGNFALTLYIVFVVHMSTAVVRRCKWAFISFRLSVHIDHKCRGSMSVLICLVFSE